MQGNRREIRLLSFVHNIIWMMFFGKVRTYTFTLYIILNCSRVQRLKGIHIKIYLHVSEAIWHNCISALLTRRNFCMFFIWTLLFSIPLIIYSKKISAFICTHALSLSLSLLKLLTGFSLCHFYGCLLTWERHWAWGWVHDQWEGAPREKVTFILRW